MKIIISTAYDGMHQDFELSQQALEDQEVYERELEELTDYLSHLDEGPFHDAHDPNYGKFRHNDGNGPFVRQVHDKIRHMLDKGLSRSYLVMAVDDASDVSVDFKVEQD